MADMQKADINAIDTLVTKRFEIIKNIGKGAYSVVWSAVEKTDRTPVAIKKLLNVYKSERGALYALREMSFLRALNHPNIIRLLTVLRSSNDMDLYFVLERMVCDLDEAIRKGKSLDKTKISYEMLNALNFMHAAGVMHRDLKPSNVLIDSKNSCKLADFGHARSTSTRRAHGEIHYEETNHILSGRVGTLQYNAPEIIIAKRYSKAVDLWSFGCTYAEMLIGEPLFDEDTSISSCAVILAATTNCGKEDLLSITNNRPRTANEIRKLLDSKQFHTLDHLLRKTSDEDKQFLKAFLVFSPESRLTAKIGLEHNYFNRFKNWAAPLEPSIIVQAPTSNEETLSVVQFRHRINAIIKVATWPLAAAP